MRRHPSPIYLPPRLHRRSPMERYQRRENAKFLALLAVLAGAALFLCLALADRMLGGIL